MTDTLKPIVFRDNAEPMRERTAQQLSDAGENWPSAAMDLVRGFDDRTRSLNPNEDMSRRGVLKGILTFLKSNGLEGDALFAEGFGLVNIATNSHNKSALLADYGIAAAETNLVEQVLELLKDDAFVARYHQEPVLLTCADMYAARKQEDGNEAWGEKAHELLDFTILMHGKTERFGHYRAVIRARADGYTVIPMGITDIDDEFEDEDTEYI